MVDAGGLSDALRISSNGVTLEGFTAENVTCLGCAGILVISDNNTLRGNTVRRSYEGVLLQAANNNTVVQNLIEDCAEDGLDVEGSSYNSLVYNNPSHNGDAGIDIDDGSHHNLLEGNVAIGNDCGVSLEESDYNVLMNNTAAYNVFGRRFRHLSFNVLRNNSAYGNRYNVGTSGGLLAAGGKVHFENDVDTTNTVEGMPVYFLIGASDLFLDSSYRCRRSLLLQLRKRHLEGPSHLRKQHGDLLLQQAAC